MKKGVDILSEKRSANIILLAFIQLQSREDLEYFEVSVRKELLIVLSTAIAMQVTMGKEKIS